LSHAPVVPKRTGWPGGGSCADARGTIATRTAAVSIAINSADLRSVVFIV
jgi:hypothetical protein